MSHLDFNDGLLIGSLIATLICTVGEWLRGRR